MRLNELSPPIGAKKERKRVGRGEASGLGRTSGRGNKGQKARSGHKKVPAWFEGGQMPIIRRLPKRGFKNPSGEEYKIINISRLNGFNDDTVVTPELLSTKRLIKGKAKIKVLGNGKLTKKLTVQAHSFSESAKVKIEATGGKAEVI